MNVAFMNLGSVSEDDCRRIEEALQLYADRVCEAWEKRPLQLQYVAGARDAPDGLVGLYAFDKPTEPGIYGFHDVDSKGRPYGRAFLDVIPGRVVLRDPSGQGASLLAVLEHELAEMIGDLYANLYADVPVKDGDSGKTFSAVAVELCDPVQDSAFSMTLKDGTVVDGANFVYPEYFNARAPAGSKFDEMDLIARPGQLLPGGYLIARDVLDDSNLFSRKVLHQVPPAPWRDAMRAAPHSRTFRRLDPRRP